MRPAMVYCCREAALRRLTSVLPSRLARTLLSSFATFSNSASRSRCWFTAWSTASGAAGFGGAAPALPLPMTVVTGNFRPDIDGLLSFGGDGSCGVLGCCDDSTSAIFGKVAPFAARLPSFELPLGLGWSFDCPTVFVLLAGDEAAATRGALAPLFRRFATEGMRLAEMSARI